MNLDCLKDQKIDPKIGAIVIEYWFLFKKIVLFSDYCQPDRESVSNFYNRYIVGPKKDPSFAAIEGKEKKPSHNTIDMTEFLRSLQINLKEGQVENLHLVKILPPKSSWGLISASIRDTTKLQSLTIQLIELGKEALEALANGIKFNNGMKRVELSYCMIQDKYAAYIAKMISE